MRYHLDMWKMYRFGHFLLSFCVLGCIFCSSTAWHVNLPRNIKGLLGSCLVIPCSFDYHQYPPQRPDRVVWYQFVSRGYPLVYDSWYPDNVINIFKQRTSKAIIHRYSKDCSLKISPVRWSDHRQTIYPWVDPENVGRSTYRFFDTTVTIDVVDRAEKPYLFIIGPMKVGQSVNVQCSVYHTCPTNPPTLSLNMQMQSHSVTYSSVPDGRFKVTMTGTINIERDLQTVQCSVEHMGGLTASSSKTLNAQCSISPLAIQSTNNEFLEGQPTKVTCIALFTCSKHMPTLTWNYHSMPAYTGSGKISNAQWKTVSTLTFTASANDHGRILTCVAQFTESQRQEVSIRLRVKRNMLLRGWSFITPGIITGIRGSCIIIPCRFHYSASQPTDLRVMWYLFQTNEYLAVFDEKQNVISDFRGKTSLIGSVENRNCSLKIERLEMSHNQVRLYPWIDKSPITSYYAVGQTFYDKTTQIIVSDHAHEPQLSIIGIPRVEEQSQVFCSVHHTCISAPPTLTLTGILGVDHTVDTMVSDGIWERKVERSWTVKEEDQSVQCTVSYQSGQKATSEVRLNVECPYEEITMSEQQVAVTEGLAKSVICSVTHKCKKNAPTIVWNFKDMQSSSHMKKISNNNYNTVSNLTFIASLGDDGNSLTCTAQFITGKTSDSAIIHVKKYEKPVEEIDPHGNDTSPEKPVMTKVPAEVSAGSTITVSCSVKHTCPSHHPEFSWSVPKLSSETMHTLTSRGIWETTSTITFMAAGGDGVKTLTCTAIFWRDKQQATTVKLTVKGSLIYQLRSSLPITIPVSALGLIGIILATVFVVVIWRKRRHPDDSLQPPPGQAKRRSLWERLSRYSEGRERPPRPEKRRSMWSRFSRKAEDERVGWQNERKPRNNTATVNCSTQFSKPRFPSPKDDRRPPRSLRPEFSGAVDHVYGNF